MMDQDFMTTLQDLLQQEQVFDDDFDALLFPQFQNHSNRHYTAIYVAKLALEFLIQDEQTHVLDIGSGVGKFCTVGALLYPNPFTGIEYRKDQVDIARQIASQFDWNRVNYLQDNVLNQTFKDYDAIYLFNPFLEHKDETAKMDHQIEIAPSDYSRYKNHVHFQLEQKPIGTRLVSYYCEKAQIPSSYQLKQSKLGATLQFWEKVH